MSKCLTITSHVLNTSKFYSIESCSVDTHQPWPPFSSTLPCFSNLPWKGQIFHSAKWRQLMPRCKGAMDVLVHSPVTHLLHLVQLVHLVELVHLVQLVHLVHLVMWHLVKPFISKGPMAMAVPLAVPLARLNGSDCEISNLTWRERIEGSLSCLQPKFREICAECWRKQKEILFQRSEVPG